MIDAGVLSEKLAQSRMLSKNIGKSLMEINNAMKKLIRTGTIYKPISVRAANFYYLIAELAKLDIMYQFTQEWFLEFFRELLVSFGWEAHCNVDHKRTLDLGRFKRKLAKALYGRVTQALFVKDVLLFAFLLAYKEVESELKWDMSQVEFFVKGHLTQESEMLSSLQQ